MRHYGFESQLDLMVVAGSVSDIDPLLTSNHVSESKLNIAPIIWGKLMRWITFTITGIADCKCNHSFTTQGLNKILMSLEVAPELVINSGGGASDSEPMGYLLSHRVHFILAVGQILILTHSRCSILNNKYLTVSGSCLPALLFFL